jgi:hypothetical protein
VSGPVDRQPKVSTRAGAPGSAHAQRVHGLMYCSVVHASMMARTQVTDPPEAWEQLLRRARDANTRNAIRSVLLQRKRVIVHWLEGELEALKTAWRRIEADSSHACVVPLFDGPLVEASAWVDQPLAHVGAERDEILDIVRAMQRERHQSDGAVTGIQPEGIATLLVLLDTSLHFAFTHTLTKG